MKVTLEGEHKFCSLCLADRRGCVYPVIMRQWWRKWPVTVLGRSQVHCRGRCVPWVLMINLFCHARDEPLKWCGFVSFPVAKALCAGPELAWGAPTRAWGEVGTTRLSGGLSDSISIWWPYGSRTDELHVTGFPRLPGLDPADWNGLFSFVLH